LSAPLGLREIVKEVLKSKSGLAGLCILLFLTILSLLVPIYFPKGNIVNAWNDPLHWVKYPRLAAPEWVEIFIGKRLPRTLDIVNSDFKYLSIKMSSGFKYVRREANFYYDYDDFPSDFIIFLNTSYRSSPPYVAVTIIRPDGLKVKLFSGTLTSSTQALYISTDKDILSNIADFVTKVTGKPPSALSFIYIFAERESLPNVKEVKVLKSSYFKPPRPYRIVVKALMYSKKDKLRIEAIIYGKVYGLAGTDNERRDILLGILWGTPISLAFGIVGSVVTTVIQAFLGAVSAWYGGKVDEVLQRATDIMLVIPILPLIILIDFVYRLTLWRLLEVLVVFSILGMVTKITRSMVLQVKSEQYIEAAISYGASKKRILALYITPRITPYTFANIVLSIPSFVFLEAALSILGLGDPLLPTLGKLLDNAYEGGALYHGYWWWVLLPAGVIMLIAIAFVLMYYPLDKILNPRLRER